MKNLTFVLFVVLIFGVFFFTCQEAMSPDQISQESDPPNVESCIDPPPCPPPPCPPPEPPACGRMTGGGSVFFEDATGENVRVTRGLELHCDTSLPNNLQVNWQGGNKFHLTELTDAVCTENPDIHQFPPDAPFDTFEGWGEGRLTIVGVGKDILGYIHFIFVDEGEPGINDTATMEIWYYDGPTRIDALTRFYGPIDRGNLQAHDDKCN